MAGAPHHAELRAGCNHERKSGKALPPKLTSTQSKVIEQLLAKHGENVEVSEGEVPLW